MTHDVDAAEDLPIQTPVEQVPITLFDLPCLAVRAQDGAIYLAIRDICAALGIRFAAQLRRLRTHRQLRKGLARFRVATDGGVQPQMFLHVQMVASWLLTINTARAIPEVQQRLEYLQLHLIAEVYAAFARLTGLPESPSETIEDLDDLQRIDVALTALVERQTHIEQSQDKARDAWRTLRTDIQEIKERVRALEQKVTGTITKAQRGTIFQLVQHWADAMEAANPRLTPGSARATCWGMLKATYKLARYEDLPINQYADCLAFIRRSYTTLTGRDLDIPEQGELDLGL